MNAEDRQFARNQIDVERWLKVSIGCLTIMCSAVVAITIYLGTHVFDAYAVLLVALAVVPASIAAYSIYKSDTFRKELDEKEAPKEALPKPDKK